MPLIEYESLNYTSALYHLANGATDMEKIAPNMSQRHQALLKEDPEYRRLVENCRHSSTKLADAFNAMNPPEALNKLDTICDDSFAAYMTIGGFVGAAHLLHLAWRTAAVPTKIIHHVYDEAKLRSRFEKGWQADIREPG